MANAKLDASTASNEQSAPQKSRVIHALVPVAALVLIGLLTWFIWQATHKPASKNIFVSGRIEGYETNLGAKIGGRVDSIAVREGNEVRKGQLVAKLSDDDIQAQLRGAEAKIAKAQQTADQNADQIRIAKFNIEQANLRSEQTREQTSATISQAEANLTQSQARLAEAQASVVQAKANQDLASIRLVRYGNLVKTGAVTKDDYDQARTTYETSGATLSAQKFSVEAAKREVASYQAALLQAKSSRINPPLRLSENDVYHQQLIQAQHQLQGAQQDIADAKANRDQIKANMAYLNIISPIDAVVTARAVEPGAVVVPGQTILSIVDLTDLYLRGYVPEGEIANVRVGGATNVYLDGFPKRPFPAHVLEVDPVGSFTPENIYFKSDRVRQVFGVKLQIDKPERLAKPGMPADAEILVP